MQDLEYVQNFSRISVKKICDNNNVDRANVVMGRTSKENIKKVKEEIESEIAKLYIKKELLKSEKEVEQNEQN